MSKVDCGVCGAPDGALLRGLIGGRCAEVRVLAETDSTNLVARRMAAAGAPHGAMVTAARQTAGRGRMGRSFASPTGGMYLSVVLRGLSAGARGLLTAAAAVAVRAAVRDTCGVSAGIKWVNDLLLDGKKFCGILAESFGGGECVVLGVGINLETGLSDFPPEVAAAAVSLYPGGAPPGTREALCAAVYTRVMAACEALPDNGFLADYRECSTLLGRRVTVAAQQPYAGVALSIDDGARLHVRRDSGGIAVLACGEVSVRPEAPPPAEDVKYNAICEGESL